MKKLRSLLILLAAALSITCERPASATNSQSGAESYSAPVQAVTVTTSGWKRVTVQTLPGSRCVMPNESGDPLVAFADANGEIDLYVMAMDNAQPEVNTSLSCTSGQTVQTLPLTYRLGDISTVPDVPLGGTAPPQKSPESLNIQVQAAIARLGFDPRTADIDVLAANGLPARPSAPSDSSAYLSWLDVATSSATRVVRQGVPTDIYIGHSPTDTGGLPSLSNPGEECNGCGDYYANTGNWAGYEGNGGQGTFGLISAQWNMPSAAAQMPAGTFYAAAWVGIDGGLSHPPFPPESNDILQTGTMTQITSNGHMETGVFWIWYEWFPQPSYLAFYTAPYNSDWCEVFKFFTNGRAAGEWYCHDATSGQTENSWTYVDSTLISSTGEWIVERPDINGNEPPLVNFGTIEFINAWAQTTTGVWFPYSQIDGPWALYDITMVGHQGTDAKTANPTYLDFDFVYKHSQ